MTEPPEVKALDAATARFRRLEKVREEVVEAVVAALKAGVPPSVVTAHSPFTATHVRNIGRDHDIPPAKPGIKARKKESDHA